MFTHKRKRQDYHQDDRYRKYAEITREKWASYTQQTRSSSVDNIFRFHNLIKRHLISKFAVKGGVFIDVATGKGGDLLKWEPLQPSRVFGMDINQSYLDEAQRRLSQRSTDFRKAVSFTHVDMCDVNFASKLTRVEPGTVDFGQCQFAIHYFFQSKETIDRVLSWVASVLKPGAYFVGTCVDGDKLIRLWRERKKDATGDESLLIYQNKVTRVEFGPVTSTLEKDHKEIYGQQVKMTLKESIIEQCSNEYLVTRHTLIEAAKRAGFVPVDTGCMNFSEWPAILQQQQRDHLDSEEQSTSYLNMSFVFRKRDTGTST